MKWVIFNIVFVIFMLIATPALSAYLEKPKPKKQK